MAQFRSTLRCARRRCWRSHGRGTEDDVGKLLELTELEGRDVFGRAALSLSPPGSFATALALLELSRAGVALLGARHLYSHVSQLPAEIFSCFCTTRPTAYVA